MDGCFSGLTVYSQSEETQWKSSKINKTKTRPGHITVRFLKNNDKMSILKEALAKVHIKYRVTTTTKSLLN